MVAEKQLLTFISYSRADKEFALALARELRSSGFHIWLDQLDIPTGSRWDDEVEKALVSCDIFMIILTSHSVASPNVRDEINYALGKNKRIMPILLESVEIPFRLQRVQYVDFTTKSRQEGIEEAKGQLQRILDELNPLRTLPPVKPLISSVSNSQSNRPHQVRPTIKPVENQPQPQLPSKRNTRMLPLLAGLALLSISCLVALWFIAPRISGLVAPNTGKMPTDDPGSYTIINPTTPVVPSLVPILPTSSPNPTAESTSSPIPTNRPTETTFSPSEPDQFLNFFFDTIIYERDYELGWSLLSETFKTNNNPTGFEDWRATWEKVVEWQYPGWTVTYVSPSMALVSSPEVWFRGVSWYSLPNREFCVIQDESRHTWIIESIAVCGR